MQITDSRIAEYMIHLAPGKVRPYTHSHHDIFISHRKKVRRRSYEQQQTLPSHRKPPLILDVQLHNCVSSPWLNVYNAFCKMHPSFNGNDLWPSGCNRIYTHMSLQTVTRNLAVKMLSLHIHFSRIQHINSIIVHSYMNQYINEYAMIFANAWLMMCVDGWL